MQLKLLSAIGKKKDVQKILKNLMRVSIVICLIQAIANSFQFQKILATKRNTKK